MRMVQSRWVLWIFALGVLLSPAALWARTIHVLIVADTSSEGIGTETDLRNLQMVFESWVPRNQLDLHTLHGSDVTKERILGTIQHIRARAQDGMAFFWSGHGAYDEKGHFLAMPNKDRLYRSDVVKAVARCGAGADAVLTDCCNMFAPLPPGAPVGAPAGPPGIPPLFASLFLDSRGLADINGCSEGEMGFGDSEHGGSFFGPLCRYLVMNAHRRMTWRQFVDAMRGEVRSEFNRRYPNGYRDVDSGQLQTTQTLRVWHLPPGWPGQGGGGNAGGGTVGRVRLGVQVDTYWGQGVVVQRVFRGSPAAQAGIVPGDVVLSINGQSISNNNEMLRAVADSPQSMQIRVRSRRTGQVEDVTVSLGN